MNDTTTTAEPVTADIRDALKRELNDTHTHDTPLSTLSIRLRLTYGTDRLRSSLTLPADVTAAGQAALEAVQAAEKAIETYRAACSASAARPCVHRATDRPHYYVGTVRRIHDGSVWSRIEHTDRWATTDNNEGPLTWAALLTSGDVVTVGA